MAKETYLHALSVPTAAPQDHTRLVPALLLLEHVPEDYASVPGTVSGLIGSLLLQTLVRGREGDRDGDALS